jgi:hypothetical protein
LPLTPPTTTTTHQPKTDLRASLGWFREGALEARRADAHGAAAPLWSTSPSPLRAGARGKVLYNSRAGPLEWLDPEQGHAPPEMTYGFNNWRVKGAAPVVMKPSKALPVRPLGVGWLTLHRVLRRSLLGSCAPGALLLATPCQTPPAPRCMPLTLNGPPRRPFLQAADGELWWEAEVEVPAEAVALSFCVHSGDCWDNNGGADHKVLPSGWEGCVGRMSQWQLGRRRWRQRVRARSCAIPASACAPPWR